VPRAHEIAGSNPAVLTYCGGTRAGTGRRLLTAPTQVRFLPPQLCALGRAAEVPGFQPGKAGSIPAERFIRGSANGRLPGFEPGDAGSSPAPRTLDIDAGSSNGRTGRSERSGVGSIPTPGTLRKSSGRMRSLSRKQVRVTPLRVRVSRLPLEMNSPVVQRQRLLAYTQATAVQVRPGLLAREWATP
jgi:hypothetical protein